MATLEKKLADQIADALSDRRFRAQFLPAHIVELPFETQEQIADMLIYLLNYWSIQYKYNNYSNTPESVGSLAYTMIEAYTRWKEER